MDASFYSTGSVVQDAILSGTLVDATPREAVTWQNVAGVTATATTLTKTAPQLWGNGGASSPRGISAATDGFAEFTIPVSPGYVMFGLNNGDANQGYADLDHAFYTYPPTGRLLIYENGVGRAKLGAYTAGDKLRISVQSGVVRYWVNGSLARTSSLTPNYPLRVDASFYSTGAVVQDAMIAGTLVDTVP